MRVGVDIGATKIEFVVLDKKNKVIFKKRISTPKSYKKVISDIKLNIRSLDKKFKKKLKVGVCHPGSIDANTGLLKNSTNATWLNNKRLNKDLIKSLKRKVPCENDANCFTYSEALNGSARNFKIVFGIILGSGTGGGIVINKKIIKGSNNLTGEWGHMPLPIFGNLNDKNLVKKNIKNMKIEKFISGKGIEKLINNKLTAKQIFNKKNKNTKKLISDFQIRLSRSLVNIIYILDPDAIVFGGGLSNEIKFLNKIKNLLMKFLKVKRLNTKFLKPKYGDASGVRGAANLSDRVYY